MEFFTS
ncbi:hypothetical protein MIMGU_mgv1a0144281mg, partial [Erythranthe guttata]